MSSTRSGIHVTQTILAPTNMLVPAILNSLCSEHEPRRISYSWSSSSRDMSESTSESADSSSEPSPSATELSSSLKSFSFRSHLCDFNSSLKSVPNPQECDRQEKMLDLQKRRVSSARLHLTQGTMKGILPEQLQTLDCEIILGNTYHLGNRPGTEVLSKAGGLHNFMGWNRALLTDSGGFQMVSLLKLAEITEEGVKFRSPYDDSEIMLTPEKSIEIQNCIGADIIMQLDDVVQTTFNDYDRIKEATERTSRWLDRCLKAHQRPTEQNIFPIVQGLLNKELREKSAREHMTKDRFGCALVNKGQLNLKQKQYETDLNPIDVDCTCSTCANYTRAYLHCIVTVETVACHLISVHNIAYQMRLMRKMRKNIEDGTFPQFVKSFVKEVYPDSDYPTWVVNSLSSVGIDIKS
ncbi:hypothetical protein MSG28_002141 [Choristoneura fumiferana]|uniref:Uncharacterized protein n=1 Tax=Choristoneura fumiferana TaxID=7141 RepID=A0ACC0JU25_CHOFU|nr:hypothetical protein MSG28_002141 [Choristoneura fumiferana]